MHREKVTSLAGNHDRVVRQLINSNFDSPGWKSNRLPDGYKSLQAVRFTSLRMGASIVEGGGRRQYSLLGTV